MLRSVPRSLKHSKVWRRKFSNTLCVANKPKVDENGLIYGKFTQEEYDLAAKQVQNVMEQVRKDVKKDFNIAENFASMQSFPSKASGKKIELDSLTKILAEAIKTTGPIPLSSFMRQALTHPQFGYYTTRDPLGSQGDFVTSPEISQMFGEMIGIWLFTTWVSQGKPKKIQLIEFGPGKGTLMFDTLKSFNKLKRSNKDITNGDVLEIVMVEASHVLRKVQWQLLCPKTSSYQKLDDGTYHSLTTWGDKIRWVDTEKDIFNDADYANYILAHEFFDALPIQQFRKTKDGWREYMVEYTPNIQKELDVNSETDNKTGEKDNENMKPDFHITLNPHETPSSLIPKLHKRYDSSNVGSNIEICPDANLYTKKMSEIINSNSQNVGACLIVDYGPKESVPSGTLRGIKDHKIVSPFIAPGEVDLSADVDFQAIADIASNNNCSVFGPVEQGDWLHELGIGYRADQLINDAKDEDKEKVYKSYTRLTGKSKEEMGSIYKFLCLLPKDSNITPVGFGGSFQE